MLQKKGEAVKKTEFPTPPNITIAEEPGRLQDMVNEAIHHALVNQSEVTTNTVYNAVVGTLREEGILEFKGPAFEQPSQAFPSTGAASAPSTIAAATSSTTQATNT